uniref:TIR domain-containing protein n=1 Tax=Roseovarius indicus TaxID=540747 RepID=UPI003B525C2C
MKIFISWSKSLSHGYAAAFRDWLPNIIQSADPFISSQDIGLGQRGIEEIESRLNEISFGILFVSDENKNEPWLLYEAGALSRTIQKAETRVIPFLIDVDRAKLTGSPLSHFQNAQSVSQENVKLLCAAINEACNEPLTSDRFEKAFLKWWPDLKEAFDQIEIPAVKEEEVTLESLADAISEVSEAVVELRNSERKQSLLIETLATLQAKRHSILSPNDVLSKYYQLSDVERAKLEPRKAISDSLAARIESAFGNEEEKREFELLLKSITRSLDRKKDENGE